MDPGSDLDSSPGAKNNTDTIRAKLREAGVIPKTFPLRGLIYLAADQLIAYQAATIRDENKREYPRKLLQDVAFEVVGVIFPRNGLKKRNTKLVINFS